MSQQTLARVRKLGFLALIFSFALAQGCSKKLDQSAAVPNPAGSERSSRAGSESKLTTSPASAESETAKIASPDSDSESQANNDSASQSEPLTDAAKSESESGGEASNQSSASSKRTPNKATEPQSKDEQDGTAAASPKPAEDSKPKSAKHEPLFKDWPEPKFALLITGQQMGYIEPCGCTGLTNQKGGLARRHTLVKQLAERGWPVLPVDVGNQVRRFGPQSDIKFRVTAEALKIIGYQAIAFGVDDLRLSIGDVASVTVLSDNTSSPFLSANAFVYDRELTPTHHIAEIGGKRVGITSVLGTDHQTKIVGSDVQVTSPQEGLDAVMPKLKDAKCDVLVLLAHASIEESQQLARKYPEFNVVVTAGGVGEPAFQPEKIPETKSILVQVGLKGMFAGVLAFYDDAKSSKTGWRYQRVPLDDRFADSPEMMATLASYQEQLKTAGLEGLGLKPVPHQSGFEYTGSQKCGECHVKAFEVWKKTPHAHATDSIVRPPERGQIARHFDPECLSCHVTGWNPQRFYPYTTGYLSLEDTPLLTASGCENCHGPGSGHIAAESGMGNPTEQQLTELRASMRLRLSKAQAKCIECHDIDNSPDFHDEGAFDRYWKKVEHKGLD